MKPRSVHGLGELQAEVMELVWDSGEATVTQIVEKISERRPVTYTTVLVAMQKLAKKGWLTYRTQGRAYVYRPARSRDQARGSLVREILKSAFEGDPRLLLISLLDEASPGDDELRELRGMIEKRRKEIKQ